MTSLIKERKKSIIEETAIELAAAFYEDCRMMGNITMNNPQTGKLYRNQVHYVKQNFEKFIPRATEILISMMDPSHSLPYEKKMEIYEALMDRQIAVSFPTIGRMQ